MTVRQERKREHRRILIAFALALLIHLLFLLGALIVLSLAPASWREALQPKPEPEPVELVIIPPEAPPEEKGFLDSSQGEVSEEAPEDARFESDQNTKAASEAPPAGDEPLPSTDGLESPEISLRNQELSLGPQRQPAPAAPLSPPQPAQPPKPQAEEKPEPTPQPTPKPEEAELALIEPAPQKPPEAEPEVRKPEPPRPPSQPSTPGFQPQRRITRLTGGISNRGRSSVAAVATPLGRYKKMLSDAIGSRWYYYVNDMLDLVNVGTVQVRFVVRADGTVEGVTVLKNSSNEALASCSIRSIIEAEMPSIPPEILPELEGERLEVDYSFTILAR